MLLKLNIALSTTPESQSSAHHSSLTLFPPIDRSKTIPFFILLCLTPDDFTRPGRTPGWSRVNFPPPDMTRPNPPLIKTHAGLFKTYLITSRFESPNIEFLVCTLLPQGINRVQELGFCQFVGKIQMNVGFSFVTKLYDTDHEIPVVDGHVRNQPFKKFFDIFELMMSDSDWTIHYD